MVILVVDDDSEDLQIFSEALEQIDSTIACIEAYNGLEALKTLRRASVLPNFIFLDINMPFMNGIKCLEEIKRNGSLKQIKVIMYSTSSDPKEMEYCKMLGADFLVKPTSFPKLIDSLTKIIGTGKKFGNS